jgi:molybdopterin molybdotransferase
MITVSEAIRILREKAGRLAPEEVKLREARGRVLAEDVVADTDLPPFDRAQKLLPEEVGAASCVKARPCAS